MLQLIRVQVTGLGLILYSPWAVAHISRNEDYLSGSFWEPEDVARHVNACSLAGLNTGSPGDFRLHIFTDPLDEHAVATAEFKTRFGLEVRDSTVCIRDLYDLVSWDPTCPPNQQFRISDGFYCITAYTSPSIGELLGDNQAIFLHFEALPERPLLACDDVPRLC